MQPYVAIQNHSVKNCEILRNIQLYNEHTLQIKWPINNNNLMNKISQYRFDFGEEYNATIMCFEQKKDLKRFM